MKNMPRLIWLCVLPYIVFGFPNLALSVNDFWYDVITGNTTHQQTGDAVYVSGGIISLPGGIKIDNRWNHAGIVFEEDDGSFSVYEMGGGEIRKISLETFKEGRQYYGAHYNPVMTEYHRELIKEKMVEFLANTDTIGYTCFDQVAWNGVSWDGTIADLKEVRCDGVVEVCYVSVRPTHLALGCAHRV